MDEAIPEYFAKDANAKLNCYAFGKICFVVCARSDTHTFPFKEREKVGLLLLRAYFCNPFLRSVSSITGVRSSLQLRACQTGSNIRAIISALARLTII